MQQAKRLASCKKTLTAYASSAGVALVTHNYLDGAQAVEFVAMHGGKNITVITPKVFFRALNEARLDEVDEEYREDKSHYQEMMELSRFRAFGDTSNFNELASERIAYDVRNEDVPFMPEKITFPDGRTIVLPGELRGWSEVYNQNGLTDDVLEPFSIEEGLDFIVKVLSYHEVTIDDVGVGPTVDLWLKPELIKAVEIISDLLVMMRERNEDPDMLLTYLEVSDEEWRRAKATVSRDSLGASWCYMNTYNIGAREGTTEDQSRQNDQNYTIQEQYHTLGERVDGRFVMSEELSMAQDGGRYLLDEELALPRNKNMGVVWSMYYKGGEVKKPALLDKLLETMELAAAMKQLEKAGEIAKPLENRGWSERSVYFLRCAAARDEVFADKLWHILTWPMDIVEEAMEDLRSDYKQSVFENRPGPGRQKVDGRWQMAPLVGQEAINHIIKTGVGTLKGKKINKDVKLYMGQTWHKLLLNKKHIEALEDAILWRKGVIKLSVGDSIIEEKFDQNISSLPREYVRRTYGSK